MAIYRADWTTYTCRQKTKPEKIKARRGDTARTYTNPKQQIKHAPCCYAYELKDKILTANTRTERKLLRA